MPKFPSPGNPASGPKRPRRGFALIVVMTLLALVVLMILSLVTMVQLSLRASQATLRQAQARQSALMAVAVAMGQLEKFAGTDQVATGAADLARVSTNTTPLDSADASTALPSGVSPRSASSLDPSNLAGLNVPPAGIGGTRYWTGIWGNVNNPTGAYGITANTSARPKLLAWLVSGNENALPPAYANFTTASFSGQLTNTPPALRFTPNMTVTSLTESSTASSNITINNKPAVLLVGPNTAGNATAVSTTAGGSVSIAATGRFIAAPLVDMTNAANAVTSRYAWWVGDEGVKAKYNMRDPYTNSTDIRTQPEARYRFAAQRAGLEVVAGAGNNLTNFASYANITGNKSLAPGLSRVTRLGQAHSLDTATLFTPANMTPANDPVRARFHDVTTYSYGVLSDALRGGLRYDLTTALEQNAVFNDTTLGLSTSLTTTTSGAVVMGRNILPDGTNNLATTHGDVGFPSVFTPRTNLLNPSLLHGPTWDQIRSFYQLTLQPTTTAIPVRPNRDTSVPSAAASVKYQVGISPVVVQARLLFTVSYNPGLQFFVHTHVLFVLGNPYSFPISAPNGLDLSYTIDQAHKQDWGIVIQSRLAKEDSSWVPNFTRQKNDPASTWPYFPILKNAKSFGADQEMSVLDNVTFKVPGSLASFAPGQIKTFSLPSQNLDDLKTRFGSNIDPQFYKNVYTKTVQTGSGPGGQHLINLVQGVNPDCFFTTATGLTLQSGSSQWGHLIRLLPVKGITLQLRTPGTAANSSLLLQALVNLDGTGGVIRNQRPDGFLQWYPEEEQPIFANGYMTWLALPGMAFNGTANVSKYRPYADYNLRATYMALSPMSPFNDATYVEGNTNTADTGSLPTVAPYTRSYIRTFGNVADNRGDTQTYYTAFNADLLTPKWGRTTALAVGQNNTLLYSLPQRAVNATPDAPLISIGQLQHVDLTADDFNVSVGYQPGYAMGNSWFSPYITRTLTKQSRTRPTNRVDLIPFGTTAPVSNVTTYDISYLLNTALWDRYYFSTIPQSGAINATAVPTPANSRLKFATGLSPTNNDLGAGTANTTLNVTDLRSGQPMFKAYAPANYLMIDGAFNVNSTSVEAWKAILASLRNLAVAQDSATGTPFPRILPSQAMSGNSSAVYNAFLSTQSKTGTMADSYAGFRRLTDADIARLALQIVKEVRARGPFLSLAQFVNRRLIAMTDTSSKAGVLQSALDTSTINTLTGSGVSAELVDVEYNDVYSDPNRAADQGNRSTGIPGWLTQADLLQVLGPVIASRSDTFVIRAYGDVVNPLDGSVQSRVWCEAVVQRQPEFHDNSDTPDERIQTLSVLNKTFGRKFRLVSFQWLNATDI